MNENKIFSNPLIPAKSCGWPECIPAAQGHEAGQDILPSQGALHTPTHWDNLDMPFHLKCTSWGVGGNQSTHRKQYLPGINFFLITKWCWRKWLFFFFLVRICFKCVFWPRGLITITCAPSQSHLNSNLLMGNPFVFIITLLFAIVFYHVLVSVNYIIRLNACLYMCIMLYAFFCSILFHSTLPFWGWSTLYIVRLLTFTSQFNYSF